MPDSIVKNRIQQTVFLCRLNEAIVLKSEFVVEFSIKPNWK
jgi:hypothetical protein